MALIPCSSCAHSISDRASQCPHCQSAVLGTLDSAANNQDSPIQQPAAEQQTPAPEPTTVGAWMTWTGRSVGATIAAGAVAIMALAGKGLQHPKGGAFPTRPLASAPKPSFAPAKSVADWSPKAHFGPAFAHTLNRQNPTKSDATPPLIPGVHNAGATCRYWDATVGAYCRELSAPQADDLEQLTVATFLTGLRGRLQALIVSIRSSPTTGVEPRLVSLVTELGSALEEQVKVLGELERQSSAEDLKSPATKTFEVLGRVLHLPDAEVRFAQLPSASQAVIRQWAESAVRLETLGEEIDAMQTQLRNQFRGQLRGEQDFRLPGDVDEAKQP